jgi:Mg-chelatase subunit ChlD
MNEARLNTISRLARGLAEGVDVRVELAAREWSWNARTRTLRVGREALESKSLASCAGLVAHELGHCAISSYQNEAGPLRPPDLPDDIWNALLNVLEDPRVEGWMMRSLPGSRQWIDSLRADTLTSMAPGDQVLWTLQFFLASIQEWARGWQVEPPGPFAVAPAVVEALAQSQVARRTYAEIWPQVDPSSRTPTPQAIMASTREALKFAVQVAPVLVELRACEARELASRLHASPALKQQAVAALEAVSGSHCIVVVSAARRVEAAVDPAPEALVTLAQRVLRDAERRSPTLRALHRPVKDATVGTCDAPASGLGRLTQRGRVFRVAAAAADSRSRPPEPATFPAAVQRLAKALATVFPPQQDPGWLRGFSSGRRVDLRQAMQLEMRPQAANELWQRRADPRKPDAAVLLLVDLSGSMRREGKVDVAVFATATCARALRMLDVSCAIVGFQDQTIPIADFDVPWSADLANRIGEMRLEVHNTRPGGHNQAGHNDDGPCLLEAAKMLARHPARQKVLIVISDGQPAGAHSGPDDLHAAIATIIKQQQVALAGIGIGPGTRHVRDFYPDARGEVPVDDFPRELGRTVVERLRAGIRGRVG